MIKIIKIIAKLGFQLLFEIFRYFNRKGAMELLFRKDEWDYILYFMSNLEIKSFKTSPS